VAIEIRELRPDEHAQAGRITAEAYRGYVRPGEQAWVDYLEEIADIADRAERTLVLGAFDEDGRIVGTLTLELDGRVDEGDGERPLDPGEAHVRMLGVAPEAQGRGIGKLLMEASIEEARAAGKTVLTLNTTPRMATAMKMYESMGFVRGPDTPVDYDVMLLSYSLPLD
jgi:GNAT superfamily N-acetyltransferase